jgi:hypothetical protein
MRECDCLDRSDDETMEEDNQLGDSQKARESDPKRQKLDHGWDFGDSNSGGESKDISDDTFYDEDPNGFATWSTCPIESTCNQMDTCVQLRETRGCGSAVCKVRFPSAGKYFALGDCINLVSTAAASAAAWSGFGKRSDELGHFSCACNASYVSNACCTSETGLIWEPPDLQLGRLEIEDEV